MGQPVPAPPVPPGDDPDGTGAARRAVIAANLVAVRSRIAAAATAAGRDPAAVTLIAVTKTFPAADVRHLAALGVADVGENRDGEAAAKAVAVAAAGVPVRWHFIGQLQRNKCRSVVGYASMVHSVDGVRLAAALGRAAAVGREAPLDVLVQVSIDGDADRGGAWPGAAPPDRDLAGVAEAVAAQPALRLCGFMAVAPLRWVPADAYDRLAGLIAPVRAVHPDARLLSTGMSADLEPAVARGATHVRVGGALLGNRASIAVT